MMRRMIFYIVLGVMYLFSVLPLRVHYLFSDLIAFLLHKVFRYRYAFIVTNLSRSFPELAYYDIKKLVGKYYHHLSDMIVEAVWALSRSDKKIGEVVDIIDVEELNRMLDKEKGVIMMLGHTGNWEIFTGVPSLRDVYGINVDNPDFKLVYKHQKNKVADMVIRYMRSKHHSCDTIDTANIVRHIMSNPKSRNVYFLLCDQNPEHSVSDIVCDFLSQKTYMIEGPERISMKMKMPVMYCGLYKKSRGRHVAHFELITEDASTCEKGYVTARYASLLENDIRKHKEQWLWSHKRWKRIIL